MICLTKSFLWPLVPCDSKSDEGYNVSNGILRSICNNDALNDIVLPSENTFTRLHDSGSFGFESNKTVFQQLVLYKGINAFFTFYKQF